MLHVVEEVEHSVSESRRVSGSSHPETGGYGWRISLRKPMPGVEDDEGASPSRSILGISKEKNTRPHARVR